MDFAVPAGHRVKIKKGEKRDKHLGPFKRNKKPVEHESDGDINCNWYARTIPKCLKRWLEMLEIRGRIRTIQTTALKRSTRRVRRVPGAWGDLLSLRLLWKSISWRWCEKLTKNTTTNNNNSNDNKCWLCDDRDETIIHITRRCPWCNGYRSRKWTRRHEFKSWTRLIAFHIALLGKVWILLGKVWIQLFSLQLWVNSRTDWVLQPWRGN